MEKEQQIEEMARAIDEFCQKELGTEFNDDILTNFAKHLYNAGYSKQRDGEWKFNRDGSGTCSECHFTQRGVWDYDNHQNFCGVCGAKMKGGK